MGVVNGLATADPIVLNELEPVVLDPLTLQELVDHHQKIAQFVRLKIQQIARVRWLRGPPARNPARPLLLAADKASP